MFAHKLFIIRYLCHCAPWRSPDLSTRLDSRLLAAKERKERREEKEVDSGLKVERGPERVRSTMNLRSLRSFGAD